MERFGRGINNDEVLNAKRKHRNSYPTVENVEKSQLKSGLRKTQMNTQKILEFKEAIYDCAKEFRRDANSMMAKLASDFDFEIKPSISFPKEVYRHYNNKGIFRGEWSFYFHGSHCRFEQLTTGQVLEVLFTHSPEFGYINPFFFLVYIKTTEKHKWLDEVLNQENVYYAIELLVKEGILTATETSIDKNLILAL